MKVETDLTLLWEKLLSIEGKQDLILDKLNQTPIQPLPELPSNDIFDLDEFLKGKEGILRLPESFDNKWVTIKSKGLIKPEKVKVLLGNNTYFTYKDWESTPTQQFNLSGQDQFAVVGIAFVCPPNRPLVTGFPDKELFGWRRDSVEYGKFAWINPPKVEDKERVTFGLSRFAYSSESDEKIYMIGKNINHNGFNFHQVKNPYKGNLYLALLNCTVHNPIIEAPQSHYYSPTRFKVRIKVEGNIATIISNNTYDQILTHWGYDYYLTSLLHFDRYVYQISSTNVLDNKTLRILDNDFNAGDNINGFGKVVTKQIINPKGKGFGYTYDPSTKDLPTKQNIAQGEFDAYICYKGNAEFFTPIDINTKFGDWWVTLSQGYGWTTYSEEHSGYFENYNGGGFHWNSAGSRITDGLILKNCTFEKGEPTFNVKYEGTLDPQVEEYINYLEGL